MNEQELYLAEKKIHEERRKRDVAQGGFASVGPRVLIHLNGLVSAVRENLRHDMSICSESALASVLDQTRKFSDQCGEEKAVTELLIDALAATLVHEARCEAARRLDSLR